MMKLLVLIVMCFSSYATDLSIFYWNVGINKYGVETNGPRTLLEKSLCLYDFSAYDVMILSEYVESKIDTSCINKLERVFPFQDMVPENKHYDRSILILSKLSFVLKVEKLDWVSPDWDYQSSQYYKTRADLYYGNSKFFTRKYIRMDLVKNHTMFKIVPYHFNNPWSYMISNFGKYLTGVEIMIGWNNPLVYQIQNFQKALESDIGVGYKKDNIVLIGDSNCPKSVKGLTPACYKLLNRVLPVFEEEDNFYSYPARFSIMEGKSPKIRIDHVQVSKALTVEGLELLGLKGSDHYPISVKVRN